MLLFQTRDENCVEVIVQRPKSLRCHHLPIFALLHLLDRQVLEGLAAHAGGCYAGCCGVQWGITPLSLPHLFSPCNGQRSACTALSMATLGCPGKLRAACRASVRAHHPTEIPSPRNLVSPTSWNATFPLPNPGCQSPFHTADDETVFRETLSFPKQFLMLHWLHLK